MFGFRSPPEPDGGGNAQSESHKNPNKPYKLSPDPAMWPFMGISLIWFL
jgi:hypothetical protein